MKNFEKKREALAARLGKYSYFVKGSISSVCMGCNRVNCICKSGPKGESYRLTYKDKNQKTCIVYIPKNRLNEVKKLIGNYKKYREILNELSTLNILAFKETKSG